MFICFSFTLLRDWLYSQSLFCMALLLHFTVLSVLSVQPAGGPSGGARLPKSLCRAGAKNEKNVGRPRAAAVAAGGIIKLSYFTWYEVPRLSCEANRINCNLRFKPPCSRLAKVTSLYRYCVYQN
jgi:hypothetical protein